MSKEYHVVGPPGAGKTQALSGSIARAVEEYGSDKVMAVSFSKAAAVELSQRAATLGIPVDFRMVGTLHAMGYRALGSPPIADTPAGIKAWNASGSGGQLSGDGSGAVDVDEPVWSDNRRHGTNEGTLGDEYYAYSQMLRAQMVPPEDPRWHSGVRGWYERWTAWKHENGMIDFQDMIELCLTMTDRAPGNPSAIFGDEAQDWSKLEQALVRHWGRSAEKLVLCADPDQSVYGFKGADPRIFLDTVPHERAVLSQSYRVPAAVHAFAEAWIGRSRLPRLQREYRPRRDTEGKTVEGKLERYTGARWKDGYSVLRAIEPYLSSTNEKGEPMTVMVEASCAYMLGPFLHVLREMGIPYANPWRLRRGNWNPLRGDSGQESDAGGSSTRRRTTTSSVQRLLAFLRPRADVFGDSARLWTSADIEQWADLVKTEVFTGGKKALASIPAGRELTIDEFMAVFGGPDAAVEALEADPDWLRSRLLASKSKAMEFPLAVARRDAQALRRPPQIFVGTIHSFKGSEADAVLLFPDLSRAGYDEWDGGAGPEGQDGVRRLFYVGATRTRETLLLASPGSYYAVGWED